jgi:chemosensory pili system protein ChpA (sensor histidine kinase/response regulator)
MIFPFTKRRKPVILLVDDNYFIKKLLTKILEAKYTVYTAADGLEALLLLHQRVKPDLIITDIEMPRMNGYEFINAIQENGLYKQIPVCILSDNHVNVIKNELGNMKVAEIFTKPFDPYNLMDKLNSALTKLQKQYHITS